MKHTIKWPILSVYWVNIIDIIGLFWLTVKQKKHEKCESNWASSHVHHRHRHELYNNTEQKSSQSPGFTIWSVVHVSRQMHSQTVYDMQNQINQLNGFAFECIVCIFLFAVKNIHCERERDTQKRVKFCRQYVCHLIVRTK